MTPDMSAGDQFDVADLFPAASSQARRHAAVKVPWYPLGHLGLAAMTAAATWVVLPTTLESGNAQLRAGVAVAAAVTSAAAWVRTTPAWALVVSLLIVAAAASAGLLAGYAPVAVAMIAAAALVARKVARDRKGDL